MDTSQLIQFTQDLVRIPSLSGQEEAVAKRVESEMRRLAFDRVWIDGNGSVIGIAEGAEDGKTILLDAHTDTVGISPGVPWQHEPFGAQIDGDNIFGRGAADMKGALAAMVHAAAALDRARLAGRVVVTASTLEEVLEGVALHAIMDQVQPDFVVIGESTNLSFPRAAVGVLRSPHDHRPPCSFLVAAAWPQRRPRHGEAIAAVEALAMPSDPFHGPGYPGSDRYYFRPLPRALGHPQHLPSCHVRPPPAARRNRRGRDRCHLPGIPALEGVNLRAEIGTGHYTAFTGAMLVCEKFFPAWLYAEDEPFVAAALGGLHAAGIPATTSAYRFRTNAAYSAGIAGIPTVGFGPATEADAHVVDERLAIPDLQAAARGYQAIIESVLL